MKTKFLFISFLITSFVYAQDTLHYTIPKRYINFEVYHVINNHHDTIFNIYETHQWKKKEVTIDDKNFTIKNNKFLLYQGDTVNYFKRGKLYNKSNSTILSIKKSRKKWEIQADNKWVGEISYQYHKHTNEYEIQVINYNDFLSEEQLVSLLNKFNRNKLQFDYDDNEHLPSATLGVIIGVLVTVL